MKRLSDIVIFTMILAILFLMIKAAVNLDEKAKAFTGLPPVAYIQNARDFEA